MWDILLYNFAANRGTTILPQSGGLFDGSSLSAEDNVDEGEDIVEMEMSHNPTVEVILSNGQALPPQSGPLRYPANLQGNRGAHDSQAQQTIQSPASATAVPDLDAHFTGTAPTASWSMSGSNNPTLDMTYDPFFQFQVPGSPFFGTWEVGNL